MSVLNLKDSTVKVQHIKYIQTQDPDEGMWVDSVMKTMSIDQKLGQLMMVPVFGREDAAQDAQIQTLIRNYGIGGIIFMKGEASTQVYLANKYQGLSQIPLMMAQDAEWGVSMRLQNVVKFPRNMTLGAIRNDSMLYKLGVYMGNQCKQVGVQVNFAPVADVNNNPNNPVIGDRSFGENKFNVVRKCWMVSKGMMDSGVLPCAKHFPGHGDTDVDSHKDLPTIMHTRARLDTVELYTFQKLSDYGIPSVMVAHLNVPSLDNSPRLPSTLSPKIVTDLLRNEMHYNGLVFTDALNMQGVAKYYPVGEVEYLAFKAGNDVLLYTQDVPKAVARLKQGLQSGDIKESEVEEKVRRMLIAKFRFGLQKRPYTPTGTTMEMLNAPQAKALKRQLYEAAVTLVKNENNLVPLNNLESGPIAYIQIGGIKGGTFQRTLEKYAGIKTYNLPKYPTAEAIQNTLKLAKNSNTIIFGVMDMEKSAAANFGISALTASLTRQASLGKNTILCLFGSPYALKNFGTEKAILMGYEEDVDAQQAVASAIFGGITVDGQLPVSASPQFRQGMGEVIGSITRFGFGYPEEVNMSSRVLAGIDSLAAQYIGMRAVPGFAIAVLRKDKIIYEKGFGKMDFGADADSIDPLYTMYDLASVTKVAATTSIAMRLSEQGILDLDKTIGEYLPEFRNTNKAYLTVRELLQHSAGLKPWIPFYLKTYSDPGKTQLRKDLYSVEYDNEHTIEVAPKLFLKTSYRDSIWNDILNSETGQRNKMVYSDLGIIITGKVIESLVGTSLDDYACTHFYQPLGMSSTMFNPGRKGCEMNCPPTELDDSWRHSVVKGYVHDPACAMLGGVTGHAGLFSNVYDMCKLLYMYKNMGLYGNRYYMEENTVRKWTTKQVSYSRRGLGWDKPNSDPDRSGQVSPYASDEAYGHLGFTGTSIWVDPTYDLVFVFLSNRTYPSPTNSVFNKKHVRRLVMDKVYESMIKSKPKA